MATGECRLDRAATNLPVLHADGSERTLPARFVFLTDARDQPVGAMAIYAEPAGGEQAWGEILPLDRVVIERLRRRQEWMLVRRPLPRRARRSQWSGGPASSCAARCRR